MKIRHTITIILDEEIEVPEGGSPHECDASAFGLLADESRREVTDRFAKIIADEDGSVSVQTEGLD